MKSYVITMKGHTQSIQAADRCIRSGKNFDIKIVKSWGVTPADDPVKIAVAEGIPIQSFREKYSRFENCLSAFLSHYSLWRKCKVMNEAIRIFEHDAVVLSSIPDIPMIGSRCINIGKPSYGRFMQPTTLGMNPLTSKRYFPGAHAYQLTPTAAAELMNVARYQPMPTDVYLHIDRFDWLEEYYPWPVEARDYFTTIQTEIGCKAKHSYQQQGPAYEIL
jgi:hypothetical protein